MVYHNMISWSYEHDTQVNWGSNCYSVLIIVNFTIETVYPLIS